MTRLTGWARWALAASSCGTVVVLVGCSGTGGPPSPVGTKSAAAATSANQAGSPVGAVSATSSVGPGPVAPLTGLAVTAVVARRPAVAVDVSGTDPVGLGSADVVFVEMTSPPRYLAVFQSAEASAVGPVAGTRPTDGRVLSVLHPLLGYDGGTSAFISVLHSTKVVDGGYAGHASLYSAASGSLTVSTAALAAAGKSDGPPPQLFTYRAPGESLASARESYPTSVRVDIPGQPAQRWSFDSRSDRWVQTAGGPRVSVANLVVQIVAFKTVYLSRSSGLTVPSARVLGTGVATIFSGSVPGHAGGTAATGSWRKPGLATVTDYLDAADAPMSFERGPAWIVLAPAGTRISQAEG